MHTHVADIINSCRRGFTLVEFLVTIGIVVFLMSLAIPAIVSSRDSARASSCRSHMHQIGVAVAAFESRKARYPKHLDELNWHHELLPDLDLQHLYASLIEKADAHDSIALDQMKWRGEIEVAVLKCPSDPPIAHEKALLNYCRNGGTYLPGHTILVDGELIRITNGFDAPAPISSSYVTDGLSCTVYLSERSNSRFVVSKDRRAFWQPQTFYDEPHQRESFAEACLAMPNGAASGPSDWLPNNLLDHGTDYDHVIGPNQPSCRYHDPDAWSTKPANSLHRGGVNVLFADGSSRFINDHVSQVVWRAIGTCNENDPVELP